MLIAIGSDPIRWRVAMGLRAQEFAVVEAVSVADVLNTLGRIKIPDAFVIDTQLDGGAGTRLALGLTNLTKTKNIPITLIHRSHAPRDPSLATLPPTISLIELSSLDQIVTRSIASVRHTLFSGVGDPEIPAAYEKLDEGPTLEETFRQKSIADKADAIDKALAMFNDVVKRIQKNKLPGPATPALLRELNEVIANADATFRDVGSVVAGHQVAAARLLALANSAYYQRGGGKVTSLEAAVGRLGLRETATILRAIAMRAYLVGSNADMRGLIGAHLKRAFLVAQIANQIALARKHPAPDEVYTIGLFYNIGSVFLLYTLALLQDAGRVGDIDIDGIRTAAKGRGSTLNRTLSHIMKLPDAVAQIAHYDVPEQPDPSKWDTVAGIIHQAIWGSDYLLDTPSDMLSLTADAQALGWDEAVVERVNGEVSRMQDLIGKVFSDA